MKRLTVITSLFGVGIQVFLVIFETFAASPPETQSDKVPIKFHNEIVNMPQAIQSEDMAALVACADVKIAPVFDVTGAVVSDPTGTMLIPNQSGDIAVLVTCPDVKIAPVFYATSAMLNGNPSGGKAVLATGSDGKIAPIFDATGAVVSDPTGTILSLINP